MLSIARSRATQRKGLDESDRLRHAASDHHDDAGRGAHQRLVQKYVPGTVAISPFGPNMRSIVVDVDPHKLEQYNVWQ